MCHFVGLCSKILHVCLVMALAVASGCRPEPGRWDQAQSDSEGKTAQQASADRLNSPEMLPPTGSGVTATDGPPPFTPGAPSASDAPVTWTPKRNQPVVTELPQIDVAALTTGDPLPGGEFNKFFPQQSGDNDRVAKQEKDGFAQYSLRRGGEEIAQLSITDLRSNPQAAEKFNQPDMTIEGYPAKKDGAKGTTLLVGQRFQVKVRSPGGQLNEQDRMNWLKQFDLAGIAGLAN
jgi:hypothetical protein